MRARRKRGKVIRRIILQKKTKRQDYDAKQLAAGEEAQDRAAAVAEAMRTANASHE